MKDEKTVRSGHRLDVGHELLCYEIPQLSPP